MLFAIQSFFFYVRLSDISPTIFEAQEWASRPQGIIVIHHGLYLAKKSKNPWTVWALIQEATPVHKVSDTLDMLAC